MKILYKNKSIEKLCTDERKAKKELGIEVATKLFAIINLLEIAANINDILAFPQYNFHALKGDLKGKYSIYLGRKTGFRLIVVLLDKDENIIDQKDVNFYTISVCIELLEVSKHYE